MIPLQDYRKWCVLQRIGAIGLLWNRASDAWLGIPGLKAKERIDIFSVLLSEGRIVAVKVQNVNHVLYCRIEDMKLIETIKEKDSKKQRCESIAPLDNMMWDRKLIQALFGFEYK